MKKLLYNLYERISDFLYGGQKASPF